MSAPVINKDDKNYKQREAEDYLQSKPSYE